MPSDFHSGAKTATAASGPWSGTFLDAGPEDGSDDDFYDAPQSPTETTTQPKEPKAQRNARDSFISILDDPFFQRYGPGSDWFGNGPGPTADPATPSLPPDPAFLSLTAQPFQPSQPFSSVFYDTPAKSEKTPEPTSPRDGAGAAGHERTSSWQPSLKSLKSLKSFSLRSLPPSSTMETVNIAVIGADGVGKSAFVQRALRLPKPPSQSITGIHLNVEGRPFVVALIELDLEHFEHVDVNPNQRINWPTNISGHIVPHIDGALMLYDVMNKDSIRDLPPTISALSVSGLPTILVATKCDNPESTRQINADAMATVFPTILTDFKTSVNAPSNTRDCLQTIVLAAVYNRQGAFFFFVFILISFSSFRPAFYLLPLSILQRSSLVLSLHSLSIHDIPYTAPLRPQCCC